MGTPLSDEVVGWIREERAKGTSIQETARRVGVSANAVSKYAPGRPASRRTYSDEDMARVAENIASGDTLRQAAALVGAFPTTVRRRLGRTRVPFVTEDMRQDWLRRQEAGESVRQIAGSTPYMPATVKAHLIRARREAAIRKP